MNNSQREHSKAPPFACALDRIAESGTSGAERAVLLAAVRWANKRTGRVWASMDKWATYAGVSVRTQQRAMRSLCAKGIAQVERMSKGGRNTTTVYVIPLFVESAEKSPVQSPVQSSVPPTGASPVGAACTFGTDRSKQHPPPVARGVAQKEPPEPPSPATANPVTVSNQPCHADTRSTSEAQGQQQHAAVLRAIGTGEELLTHANATPERLEWLASQVASRTLKNPAGFVATAILKAWTVPREEEKPASKVQASKVQATRARVKALPVEQQQALLAQVRRSWPNLRGFADNSTEVVGAMAKVLQQSTEVVTT